MHSTELVEVSTFISELEQHFAASLTPRLRDMFTKFVLESFATAEAFGKACDLVARYEEGYGRFPPFARFLDLYREHLVTTTGACYSEYKALPPSDKDDRSYRCLCCLDQGLLPQFILSRYFGIENNLAPEPYRCGRCLAGNDHRSDYCKNMLREECEDVHNDEITLRAEVNGDLSRLKAKIHVSGYLLRPRIREEAIAEAEVRGIDLLKIGVVIPDATSSDAANINGSARSASESRGLKRSDRRL